MDLSNSLLMYGPPGTGKTYNTVNYAVAIIEGRDFEDVKRDSYSDNLLKYDRYTKMGRITFMTFHQSLGYDDFIEGIKPVVAGDAGESLLYLPMPGVFYDFCRKSEFPRFIDSELPEGSEIIGKFPSIWIASPGGFGDNEERRKCFDNGLAPICIEKDGIETVFDAVKGDIVISLFSESTADAIGVVTENCEDGTDLDHVKIKWLKFFDPVLSTRCLRISDKEVKEAPCKCAFVTLNEVLALIQYGHSEEKDEGNCVFIIDEINRGNISRIFGEMITLLESSRRKGLPECLEVWLPQMKRMFSIPQKVFVLGTMNTADKSLAALDTALRRRFEFVEMMPDPSVLMNRVVSEVNLGKLLAVMNQRIELLYDREHTMGHAYFISVRNMEQLAQCFVKKVIPLLQEYFFDDYEKMCWVMGRAKNPRECAFIRIRDRTDFQLTFDLPDVFEIVDDLQVFMDPQNYIKIYEGIDI